MVSDLPRWPWQVQESNAIKLVDYMVYDMVYDMVLASGKHHATYFCRKKCCKQTFATRSGNFKIWGRPTIFANSFTIFSAKKTI